MGVTFPYNVLPFQLGKTRENSAARTRLEGIIRSVLATTRSDRSGKDNTVWCPRPKRVEYTTPD